MGLATTKVCNLLVPCGGCLHERFCISAESLVAKHLGTSCLICISSENPKILRRKNKQQLHQLLTTKHLQLQTGMLSQLLLPQLIGVLKLHQLQMLPKIGVQSPCLLPKLTIGVLKIHRPTGVLSQLEPQQTGVLLTPLLAGIKFE